MGYYTRFKCRIKLSYDIPEHVIAFLNKTINDHDIDLPEGTVLYRAADVPKPAGLDHEFFKCDRWSTMLLSRYDYEKGFNSFKKIGHTWVIELDSDFKNYDSEIEKFIDWIKPYVKGRKKSIYLGWSKGESSESQQRHYHKFN